AEWPKAAVLFCVWLSRCSLVQFGASFPLPLNPSFLNRLEMRLRAFALRTQNVAMTAHRVNELQGIIAIDLAPESGNAYFNYVAEFLPVVVVEMLQQLALGNHRTRPVRQVFQYAVFHAHKRNLLLPAFHSAFDRIQLQVGYREHR